MLLKRLELSGFKTFVRRTSLEFEPGLNVIVGPNGSGKSNLVDAIRWVLGEQSARSLRGQRMDDLIFSGSPGKKPVGIAEVVLTLDHRSQILPIEFDEIELTRKLDRSGQSDYRLNKVPCRLRDFQELFYDTGIGKRLYSIIGQGEVDELLDARPEERRRLFEEAAGITKYKVRRMEALRHLNVAEYQLQRMYDLLGQLNERIPELAERADRAERYLLLREQVAGLSRRAAVLEAHDLLQRSRSLGAAVRELHELRNRTAAKVEDLLQEDADRQQQLAALEGQYEVVQQELLHASKEAERAQAEVRILDEKMLAIDEQESDLATRILEAKAMRERMEARITEAKAGQNQILSDIAKLEQQFQDARKQDAALEERSRRDTVLLEQKRGRLASLLTELERIEGGSSYSQQALQKLRQQQVKSEEEAARILHEQELAKSQSEGMTAGITDLEKDLLLEQAEHERLHEEKDRLESEVAELNARLDRVQSEREQLLGRQKTLQDMEASYEGFFRGVREVLKGRDQGLPQYRGVCGVISELVHVEKQLETAMETALGAGLQYLVTLTERDAQQAIEALKSGKSGRATFLPLDILRPGAPLPEDEGLAQEKGAVGWAGRLVAHEDVYRPAIEFLLARILITEDLRHARKLARQCGYRYRMVTLDGEVIHPGGSMTGGYQQQRSQEFLGRTRQIREMGKRILILDQERNMLAEARSRQEARLRDLGLEMEQSASRRQALQWRKEDMERRIREARQRYAQAINDYRRIQEQMLQLSAETEAAEQDEARRISRCQEIDAERQDLLREVTDGEKALREETAARERAQEKCRLLELELVRKREYLMADGRSLDELSGQCSQWHDEEQRLAKRMLQLAEEKVQLQAKRDQAQQSEKLAVERREESLFVTGRLQEQRSELAASLDGLRHERERLQSEADSVNARLQHLAKENGKLQYAWANLAEYARDRQMPLRSLLLEQPELDGMDVRSELEAAEKKLAGIGPVDPSVIEEYRAVSKRHDFLAGHCADLEMGREFLEKLTGELDQHMESTFRKTFRKIQVAFHEVFTQLFQGGGAELMLVDDEGESSGIDVMVQPPGKKLQHLSMLSGGERALTAIALMFAFLRVRPSPFCILDEIDAPLDEANVCRFARFLREAADKTQFLVVTHQKSTMEVADRLFGVALQEKGISQLVAVRLSDWQDGGELPA